MPFWRGASRTGVMCPGTTEVVSCGLMSCELMRLCVSALGVKCAGMWFMLLSLTGHGLGTCLRFTLVQKSESPQCDSQLGLHTKSDWMQASQLWFTEVLSFTAFAFFY